MAKTAKAKTNTEVIELEAEEIPLEKRIENTLVKHNVTEAVIAGLKEKYGGLVLRSVDNKEDYLEIKAAKKDVRKYGILTEQLCKKGREDAIAIQKKWLAKEKEILGKIAEVEDPLEAEIDKYEKEQERLELEEVRKKENAFAARQSQLIKMGATYLDGHYTLDHISFDATLIKESDEDTWAGMLSKYQAQYEKNEAAKIEEERKREAAAEALRLQQAEMDRQRREFEAQQAEFKKQQDLAAQQERDRLAAISREEQERDRLRREADQKAEDERREKNRRRLDARINQLIALGMNFNFQYDCYAFEDVNIDNKTELCLWTDDEWEAKIKEITPVIEQRKQAAEEKRQAEIKERERVAAEQAAQRERERIAEEQRQAKIKEEQETARKAEEALQATDKTKWQAYIAYHTGGVVPEMKSPSYRAKIAEAQKMMQKIINL